MTCRTPDIDTGQAFQDEKYIRKKNTGLCLKESGAVKILVSVLATEIGLSSKNFQGRDFESWGTAGTPGTVLSPELHYDQSKNKIVSLWFVLEIDKTHTFLSSEKRCLY